MNDLVCNVVRSFREKTKRAFILSKSLALTFATGAPIHVHVFVHWRVRAFIVMEKCLHRAASFNFTSH